MSNKKEAQHPLPEKIVPLEKLPEDLRPKFSSLSSPSGKHSVKITQQISRLSPFPPPEELEIYEKFSPGFLTELLALKKQEQEAEIQTVKKALSLKEKDLFQEFFAETLGQIMAFIIALAGISSIFYALYLNAGWPIIDSLAGIFGLGTAASIFLTTRPKRKKKQQTKESE